MRPVMANRALRPAVAGALACLVGCSAGPTDAPLQPVPYARVEIADEFWAPKMEVNRTVSIQHLFRKYEQQARVDSSRVIEAAAYMLATRPDPDLERYVDGLVDKAVASLDARLRDPANAVRVSGYFLEAAVAYAEATGKSTMLDAAIRAADAMDATYGPGKKTYISGHEGLKIGLVRLYRATGDPRYLRLARFFLDERGRDDYPREGEYALDRTYAQDHARVVDQTEAVGHAVRATYLYTALADIAALTGDSRYTAALDRIWEDATYRKTYVTGAIGSIRFHEQFGAPYELPNLSAWGETCASYGSVQWNQRMFLLHRDARYVDLLERVLYNGFLDGVSLEGNRFFYQNPLTSYGNYERFDWINTPCCPPNVVRLMASLGGYVYATADAEPALYVNLFVGSQATVPLDGGTVAVRQETRYPWDGRVTIAVAPDAPRRFTVNVRIPGWTGRQVMPGELYLFARDREDPIGLTVNGQPIEREMVRGFARIERRWTAGDTIELTLPMPVRRVRADDRVREDAGRVALARGPLVYAAEWADNGGHALDLVVPDEAPLASAFRSDLLNGVVAITGPVTALTRGPDGVTVASAAHELVAIPYYAWANRGMGEMQVWLPRDASGARVTPIVPPAPIARVRSSGSLEKRWTGYNDQNDDLAAVYDGVDPLSSADESHLYFRMRPPPGASAYVEYTFDRPTTVSTAEVYFVDDRRFCRLPSSWQVVYEQDGRFVPVAARDAYGVEKDVFNRVAFDPVTTTAVRIVIEPRWIHYAKGEIGPPDAMFLDDDIDWGEIGVIEWRVR